MPSIRVHKPNGALFFDFRFNGERCREYTLLPDTPANRKKLEKVLARIEAEIQAKGLNAPRLNPQMIDDAIVSEQYHGFPGTTMTVCALTLRNGFITIGESAAASPENFDKEIGRKIARENARNKIWALEGYLLRSKLAA